jgi:hypothetical protein
MASRMILSIGTSGTKKAAQTIRPGGLAGK